MWHATCYKGDMHQWLHLHLQSIHHEQSLTFNTVALIFLFKDKKIFCTLTYNAYSDCQTTSHHSFWKMENSFFTPCLDKLFGLWNNALHWMNYWVCTAGRYRAMSILGWVHLAFFNHHLFNVMTYILDENVLAMMMTTPDLESEKAMLYQNEGYESDNDYGLPPHVMRPAWSYSVSTTEASFNPADYKEAQHTISPFMPRQHRSLPFHEGICQHLTFDETPPPMPEVDSDDEDYLLTADLYDPVWSEEPVQDSQEYLCINEIPRPETPPPQPNHV